MNTVKIVVAGTGTDVGKTWFTCRLVEALRAGGVTVAARKPAQSYAATELGATDAELLGLATGEDPKTVCPAEHWFPSAMAPPMAAARLGRSAIDLASLIACMAPTDADVVIIETAGGVRSPIADDADTVELCRALRPDVVIVVADARLGAINAVRLACDTLREHRLVVVLNRYDATDALQLANLEWLRTRDGLDVVTDIEAVARRIEVALRS